MLPRLVGLARAKELALLGERVSAEEALSYGMVSRVFAPDELLPAAMEAARKLAKGSPPAITLTKRMMNRSFEASMESALDSEWMAQSFLFSTEESNAGVERFLNKSKTGSSK